MLCLDLPTHSFVVNNCYSWADAATNMNHVSASFDQETAAVVMARMAVAK